MESRSNSIRPGEVGVRACQSKMMVLFGLGPSDFATASIDVAVKNSGADAPLSWSVVDPDGEEVAAGEAETTSGTTEWQIDLREPRLWWPSTHGTPHLYRLDVRLGDSSRPLYASEVGRASAPSLASMRRFLSEEELWPEGFDPAIRRPGQAAWPPMWQYRSVGGSWDKVGPLERFCDPKTPEELIRVLGTAHGEYLSERVERQRRGVPDGKPDGNRRCWGNMVWRLNDSWPILYWAVID